MAAAAAAEYSIDCKLSKLVEEARPSAAALRAAAQAADAVAELIKRVPQQQATPEAARGFVRDLGLEEEKLAFTFRPPEVVRLAGSHAVGAVTRPDVAADLLVRLPKECFHEKDFLNHRYHAKRCLYLCVIEKNLRSSRLIREVSWSTFQDEARKPVLHVYPATEIADLPGFYVRIIPTANSLFNVSKLNVSTRNNVRAYTKDGINLPTPKYNCSILEDMFLEENAEFMSSTFADWKALQEALVLVKHICILVATSKVWAKGLVIQSMKKRTITKEDIANCLKTFDIAIWDISGHVNLAFRMTKSAFVELQDEAACALSCLDKCRDGGFEELFMTKVDFGAKFDSCLRINLKDNSKVTSLSYCVDNESWRILEKDVQSLLQQGLTDRTKMIRVLWRSTPSEWKIMDGFSEFGSSPLLVGIMLSSLEKSFRLVDIGPNPENRNEAIKFRKFWGEKAELRRFKDGNIAESTVWESESWERHAIIKRIADYVLMKHLSLQKDDLIHVVDQLDFCLLVDGQDPVSSSGALLEAFDTLSKQLRLLDDVPLRISTVQPLDSAFRHTSVFPPEPHPLAYGKNSQRLPNLATTCIRSMEIMIQLEGSGNWPLDPVAMEKTKTAFLLKIGESLEDRGMFVSASEDEVNVLSSGYSFLLKIFHERGLVLQKQAGDDNIQTALSQDKVLFQRSQHSSMINGLHGRYQMYGPVVRLAKRWISAHLFSSFISEEAVELVVAYLFLKPFPFHAPSSRVAGFLRFLRLLSSFDWTFSPMILDINNEFNLKDEKEINENFMMSRKSYEQNPHDIEPAMFLATSYDKASEAWTKQSPSKSVLKRLAAYAKSSAELLTNLILNGQSGQYSWECLFRTPMSNYDAVVLLHQEKLCRPDHVLFPAETPNGKLVIWGEPSKEFHPYMPLNKGAVKSLHDARDKLLVNFDPTTYFRRDLKGAFPKTFKLWYGSLGGDAVGLTWENPKKRGREEDDETMPEPTSILKEVGDLGKGLVRGVYLLKAPKLQ
ncbi:nucleolar protein 6 isoform X2 [Panicum miliaceum]|uniref:Nucleolar protein 6 isoform X2 n=1 Tax=Panicum miliaceum TaxID=4540 RepID=A0A3L6T145_PANMI|nr:nucleolar protein 6 isoform X2 [Panicum miliaceum]